MKRQLAQARYDVQVLKRDNDAMIARIAQADAIARQNAETLAALQSQIESRLNALRQQLETASQQQKEQIIASVSAQIEQFAADTQRAFDQLQRNAAPDSRTAAPGERQHFDNNFPKNGIEYTVVKGDNFWKIAQQNRSKVDWIQNANKIARPQDLQIGQVLFIPQQD